MTDDTDDPSGADTPGPEASAEQDALVRGSLGSLRADDPAIPDHVAARLDAVLAEVRRQAPLPIGRSTTLAGAEDPGVEDPGTELAGSTVEGTAGLAPVTVLPTQSRGPSSRSFRLLAGAAAAVVVVGGGAAIVRGGVLGDGSSASGGATAVMADSADAYVRSTGTAYTRTGLAAQAAVLVSQTRSAPPTSDAAAAPETAGGPAAAKGLLSAATIPACVEQLAGRPGVAVVAVDQATYEGKAANVIVLPSEGDVTTLEVWVVGPGCTADTADLLEWQRISAP